MAIKAKSKATFVERSTVHYEKGNFAQHEKPYFKEVTAEQVLAQIKPITFDFLPAVKLIAIDTETFYTGVPNNRLPSTVVRRWIKTHSGDYIPNDFPFCISISDGTNSFAVYDTLENGFKEFKKLKPLLEDTTVHKVGHNIGYDMHMLANARVDLKGRLYDSQDLSKLTRANAHTHNLEDVSDEIENLNELNPEYAPTCTIFQRMVDSYKAQFKVTDYRMFPRELMTQYTCADTWNAIWAFKILYPRMLERELLPLFEIESQMLLVAYYQERVGVKLDYAYKDELIPELQKEVDDAEREIYRVAGSTFNINSSAQVYAALDRLGQAGTIRRKKPTETMLAKGITIGNICLDKTEMERLEDEGVPLITEIMQFRRSEKLLNTFAIKIYEMADFDDTLHCNINKIEAKTGRFSISAPSMQNMPRRKDSRVRGAFIAPEGYTLYDFDFKAQESLILVHYSRSPYLLDIVNSGGDIHKAVAALIYSLEINEVSKELRNISKSVEFAIIYGAGPGKIVSMTGLTLLEARMAVKKLLQNAPEIDIFIRTTNKTAKERGFIRTIMRRPVYVEKGREYACVNYVCQGSAADSTKCRMVDIHRFLHANKFKTKMILQVHDSLLQQVHDGEEYILGWLRWLQTDRYLFRVTVTVDVAKCVPTWRNKEDVDVEAIEPPAELMERMAEYDIWSEGLFVV